MVCVKFIESVVDFWVDKLDIWREFHTAPAGLVLSTLCVLLISISVFIIAEVLIGNLEPIVLSSIEVEPEATTK